MQFVSRNFVIQIPQSQCNLIIPFSSPTEVLRRIAISKVFGLTYSGDELRYPGIWFSFDEDTIGEGLKAAYMGDRMQEVKRIILSQIDPGGSTNIIPDALDEVHEWRKTYDIHSSTQDDKKGTLKYLTWGLRNWSWDAM